MRPPPGFLVALSGLAVLLAGLAWLDVPLLLSHERTQGWVSNVSYTFVRGKKAWSVSYAYLDGNGTSYNRSIFRIGHETSGDTFQVLYDPKNPGRHKILTLAGLVLPLGTIGLGLLVSIRGWKTLREGYPLWREGRRRARKVVAEADLEREWGKRVRDAVAEVARKAQVEGSHAFSGSDLSLWFVFRTDADFERAVASGLAKRIEADARGALERREYPGADGVFVGFRTRQPPGMMP